MWKTNRVHCYLNHRIIPKNQHVINLVYTRLGCPVLAKHAITMFYLFLTNRIKVMHRYKFCQLIYGSCMLMDDCVKIGEINSISLLVNPICYVMSALYVTGSISDVKPFHNERHTELDSKHVISVSWVYIIAISWQTITYITFFPVWWPSNTAKLNVRRQKCWRDTACKRNIL